jgi:hypothetical protein
MIAEHSVLIGAYTKFNVRDLDGVLALMHPEVDWPNGWEGGRVRGHDGVREYWTHLWAVLNPRVEPIGIATDADGRTVVTVRQVVRDLAGATISDDTVEHVYQMSDGLILRMEIRPSAPEADVNASVRT